MLDGEAGPLTTFVITDDGRRRVPDTRGNPSVAQLGSQCSDLSTGANERRHTQKF